MSLKNKMTRSYMFVYIKISNFYTITKQWKKKKGDPNKEVGMPYSLGKA